MPQSQQRRMVSSLWIAIGMAVLGVASVGAEVVDATANAFTVRTRVTVAVPPARAYAVLVEQIGKWWNPDHTFSGDSANLRLDVPAGCLCESLPPDGSVRHLEVVFAQPGHLLRMTGGLGPLQPLAVTGSLTINLNPDPAGTRLVLEYRVAGHADGGLVGWAGPVDGVLAGQIARLKRFAETGSTALPPSEP